MAENILVPTLSGVKDKNGEDLYNLNLTTKVDKGTGQVYQGMAAGDSIIIEKLFEGGFETKFDWSIKAKYNDKTCSFFMKKKFFEDYKACGGIGDKVRIIAEPYEYTYQGKKGKTMGFKFELLN
jgi:hypothetical protein